MKISFLADQPHYLPQLAQWYFNTWGHELPGRTLAGEAETLQQMLHRDQIPLVLIAHNENQLIGAAQLKYHEMPQFPRRKHWLGGVYVDQAYRGQGLAAKLIERLLSLARELDVKQLYLQTERQDGGLYRKLGWEPLEAVVNHGVPVLVMKHRLV